MRWNRHALDALARERAQRRTLVDDVLEEVCQTRQTESARKLRDDLVRRNRILRFGDSLGLVLDALRDLNERGLVVYYEGRKSSDLAGEPIGISATTAGFETAGYRLRHSESGTSRRMLFHHQGGFHPEQDGAVRRPGDRTDYRTHDPRRADGGEIETMPLALHVRLYPDHAASHLRQMREMTTMKYGHDQLRAMLADQRAGMTYRQIAEKHGIPVGSTFDVLARAEREIASTLDLGSTPTNGHTPWADVVRDAPPPEDATEAPDEVATESERHADEAFPLLDGLLARRDGEGSRRDEAERVLEAAALIESIDPARSADLQALAESLAPDPFTAIEAEYLRFYDTHGPLTDDVAE